MAEDTSEVPAELSQIPTEERQEHSRDTNKISTAGETSGVSTAGETREISTAGKTSRMTTIGETSRRLESTEDLSQNPTEMSTRERSEEPRGGENKSVGMYRREEVDEVQQGTAEGCELGGVELVAELRRRRQAKQRAARIPKVVVEAPVVGPVDPADFLKAASKGKLRVVEKFLQDGGDSDTCNKFRKTALHQAAQGNHTVVIKKLLEHGADIGLKDKLDSTAVHWACRGGSLAALKLLHNHGANLKAEDKLLSTPLHVATRTGHCHVVDYLITSGVKINCKDREGDTALHDAVRLNRQNIAKLLILSGAETHITNAEGLRAMEQLNSWQSDTLEMLKKMEQLRDVGQ